MPIPWETDKSVTNSESAKKSAIRIHTKSYLGLFWAETRPPIKFCGNPTNTQCFRVFFVFMQSDRARYSVSLCKVKPTGCSMYICSVFNRHIYQYCQHSHLTRCKKANNCFPKCQQFLLRKTHHRQGSRSESTLANANSIRVEQSGTYNVL